MSHCAIRMCSSRCQKVYGTFGGLTFMSFTGKPLTASASDRCASPSRKVTSRLRSALSVCMQAVYPAQGLSTEGGPPRPAPLGSGTFHRGGPAEGGAELVESRAHLVSELRAPDGPLQLVAQSEYLVGRDAADAEDQGSLLMREG